MTKLGSQLALNWKSNSVVLKFPDLQDIPKGNCTLAPAGLFWKTLEGGGTAGQVAKKNMEMISDIANLFERQRF